MGEMRSSQETTKRMRKRFMKSGLSVRQRNVSSPPPNVWFSLCGHKKKINNRQEGFEQIKIFRQKGKEGHKKNLNIFLFLFGYSYVETYGCIFHA